jgi:hypothetical protein
MPSYLDFNSTKRFRDFIIGKTINRLNGPQTFSENDYSIQNTNEFSNIDLPDVDNNRSNDLSIPQGTNVFKPFEYFVKDNFDTIQRRANLELYWNGTPYFLPKRHSLIGVLSSNNFDDESELFKFAATTIKNDPDGPFQARVRQNFEANTVGRVRLIDALNGNTATAFNIVKGKEPLVEFNNRITTSKTLPGKGIDFLQTLAGFELPFAQIPGDYLTDPRNPTNIRPSRGEAVSIIQDVTGALGSVLGIQRRPKQERKPSDLFIEYMGQGQKQTLFDLLSFSTYAPNYTTTARSQNSSKIFNFVDQTAQGVKSSLGLDAPRGLSYIGDDRGEDVTFAMNDFTGRPVRSNFYLSLLFDPTQTRLFQRQRNVSEGGQISGKLTWYGVNSRNKLGINNNEWGTQQSQVSDSLSTQFRFRDDSILSKTQDLIDSMPTNGAESRSHVGNMIDQTSRIFREGDVMLSRGSAIQYVDKFGEESGVEYCRVWTKDRGYFNYSDTMKRTGNVRKYEDSVMSTPWNLNIAPISNGGRSFDGSTNIEPFGDGFRAKKYMFSIENLAWKTSDLPGFSYNDLPYCERGPNEGRIMWFPPYDLKVQEQNSARWDSNLFVGRPEPIYTYQSTERSGTLSFKIVVDHPSILNLLVKEFFKDMSDEESENYINSFFAGCEEIDFYDLIRRYSTLTPEDANLIVSFLNDGNEPNVIQQFRTEYDDIVLPSPEPEFISLPPVVENFKLNFPNDFPIKSSTNDLISSVPYGIIYRNSIGNSSFTDKTINELDSLLREIYDETKDPKKLHDRKIMLKTTNLPSSQQTEESIETETGKLTNLINESTNNYEKFVNKLNELKSQLEKGEIQDINFSILSSTSAAADDSYNYRLSVRRTHSIVKEVIEILGKEKPTRWIKSLSGSSSDINPIEIIYSFKELGYDNLEGNLIFETINAGEKVLFDEQSCTNIEFQYRNLTNPSDPKTLLISSPLAFGCRSTNVVMTISEKPRPKPTTITNTNAQPSRLIPDSTIGSDIPSKSKKPAIDPMKKIIMKTLSECYYFQKLEESDPVVFSSLKEKLKYFHPAFHSTTPEGLNSRLTFLLQCVRPGDTIPIKGLTDEKDLNARNTSFGPPPICVLRIGDFYHSKIIIRNVDITFEDSTWDLNPEGIGVQPMIANVSLQINFIGGQGIKSPVSRLQNALSSNFFANTEMYDERSINTAENIGEFTRETFTKNFLEEIQKNSTVGPNGEVLNSENNVIEGFIGNVNLRFGNGVIVGIPAIEGVTLSYNDIVDKMYDTTINYFNTYESTYNNAVRKYGPVVSSLLLHPIYRKITDLTYFTTQNGTENTLQLHGEYKVGEDLSRFIDLFKKEIEESMINSTVSEIFDLNKILSSEKQNYLNRILRSKMIDYVKTEINGINEFDIRTLNEVRNEIINTLDNLNFIVKNGYDASSVNQKYTKSVFVDDISSELYTQYSETIDLISTNTSIFYNDIDGGDIINFYNPSVDIQKLKDILSVLIVEYKIEILNIIRNDEKISNDRSFNKVIKNIEKFFESNYKQKNFKFKLPKVKRTSELVFEMDTQSELSDLSVINELLLTRSTRQPKIINNKLNFYRQ